MKTTQPDLVDTFNDEGYVILRGLLEPEVVSGARRGLEKLVDKEADALVAAGKISDPLKHEPFETRRYRLYENFLDQAPLRFRPELHLPELYPVFFHRQLLDAVEQILGPEILLYPNYTSRPKFPKYKRAEVLWHQDGGYTEKMDNTGASADVLRMVNVWAPLVPAHEEHGCMQFIPRSHTLGSVPHAAHPEWKWLEISREFLEPRLNQAITIEMDPGDVVLFHNMLFHQGLPNRSNIIRWNLDWRYLDASQSTMRRQKGHMARSKKNPDAVVKDAADWSMRSFT